MQANNVIKNMIQRKLIGSLYHTFRKIKKKNITKNLNGFCFR